MRSVSLMTLYCSVGVEDEPKIHDFEMIRSVRVHKSFIIIFIYLPFSHLVIIVFIFHFLRSYVSSLSLSPSLSCLPNISHTSSLVLIIRIHFVY